MQYNLNQDVATLTTIPINQLDALTDKANLCICDYVSEAAENNENVATIDIGIGFVYISFDDKNVYYKFAPKEELDKAIKATIISGDNPLIELAEKKVVNRILQVYKDYI